MYRLSYRKLIFTMLLLCLSIGFVTAQVATLDPVLQPKYVNPLPIPAEIDVTNGGQFDMEMAQTQQMLGIVDPGTGLPLMTTVWGYGLAGAGVTFPGPTFIARSNVPVNVNWINNLPGHFLPVDATLHMAHPSNLHTPAAVAAWYALGNVPTVAHLHGGHTEWQSDGLPEAWYNQSGTAKGAYYVKQNYTYHNTQEAATLWYHDHALGITRLNVYAGLAGFYLLGDKNEKTLVKKGILPKPNKHEVEIVIQDRMFYPNGELYFPSDPSIVGPAFDFSEEEWSLWPNPTAAAEFFGDHIVVNGVTWPFLSVEPRPYRFRLLNGSDSRFYVLRLAGDAPFLQIASDVGLLNNAVSLTELIIAPGERAEIIIDFGPVGAGNSIELLNFGPDSPFGGLPIDPLDLADPQTTGKIMQFQVTKKLKVNGGFPIPTVAAGTPLRAAPIVGLVPNTPVPRKLALFEGMDADGRLQPLLGVIDGDLPKSSVTLNGSLAWFEAITENPMVGDIEIWEIYNNTADAHPIHLHQVAFQILDRTPFTATVVDQGQIQHDNRSGVGAYVEESSIILTGAAELPAANEMGWKDTFIIPPGYMGRVIAKFDLPGRYVWHCHILSHEDHEMMRPFNVGPIIAPTNTAVALAKASSIAATSEFASVEVQALPSEFSLSQNYPNPFNPTTEIPFALPQDSYVQLKIYNSVGQEIATLIDGNAAAGFHTVQLNAGDLASGVYFYHLTAGSFNQINKMLLVK